jgi:glycosyltransferase involved in cell wall biosynthesis
VSTVALSAVVLTQNNAVVIARCLRSLAFADEVVVVDAQSGDGTDTIARESGARVVSNPWPGFAEQRRLGVAQASGEWIFMCDSDEEVTPELAGEVLAVVARGGGPDGYRVHRRNQFLGGWIEHGPWARDTQMRLFRRAAVRITEQSVHEGAAVDGETPTLAGRLLHYTHPTLAESFGRGNRYSTLEARDRAGRRRIGAADIVLGPMGVFLRFFFVRGCWRDGRRGYLLSATTAMYFGLVYIKTYLLQRGTAQGAPRVAPRDGV